MLIVGAGAAGLFCARAAAQSGLDVILLERGAAPGRKLGISGGGRANFTNRHMGPQHYLCHGRQDFCVPALQAFTPDMILRQMRQWRLPVEERSHGQIFLTVPARQLVQALANDCRRFGCRLYCHSMVKHISRKGNVFEVTGNDMHWRARAVVLAMGSPAWPQAGGSGAGFRLAQSLGLSIIRPRPALTPLLLEEDAAAFTALAGISLPVTVSLTYNGDIRVWEDDLLFTHEGLSGPAALKASLFWQEGTPLTVDFLPGLDFAAMLDAPDAGRQSARSLLGRHMPQRLADLLLPQTTARRKLAELSRKERIGIVTAVSRHEIIPAGRAGLKKAEVCAGGVNTDEIEAQNMQSRLMPGLYVIGEMLDVTGLLGGYNLHWAWASAMAAARNLATV